MKSLALGLLRQRGHVLTRSAELSGFAPNAGTFASTALDADSVHVEQVRGTERLGQLYEFRVRIAHDKGALTEAELDDLLLAPCSLTFEGGAPIHGIAREVEILSARDNSVARYEVVLVPTVWLLTISRICRLYQKMSVKEMADDVLTRYRLNDHCDLRIDRALQREFCIQYQESDWDFLQRWFEHEGYFYWFEHSEDGEKLVVADSNARIEPIADDPTIPYRDAAGLVHDEDSIFEWRGVQRRIPSRVVLKDYNEQKPLLSMMGRAEVDPQKKRGFGVVYEYGENFDTPDVGNALAKKRAERFLTERMNVSGVTDSPRFHVGHWFELTEHFQDHQNRKYLITAIHHRADAASGEVPGYRAYFEAIPFDVQFRPERQTAWPCIHGLMHGHIDSDSSGKFSTLDEQGRYRVRFPFDSTGKTGEGSSAWVRMAQHYAGSAYGMHFPLHKGTEVLLGFYDGDPDRPTIVGSVPNALTPSPSAAANATQSVIKTASGIQFTMEDSVQG
jgi:type VI secretion system secreted protein VgrG